MTQAREDIAIRDERDAIAADFLARAALALEADLAFFTNYGEHSQIS